MGCSCNVHWMRDVHQHDSQGICTRLFSRWDVDRSRERWLEWLLVDVSIATRSWGSWSAVSTLLRRLGLVSMLAGLFVPFEVRIQFDATMERHRLSMQDHRQTDEHARLQESVEPFHSEREEIGSVQGRNLKAHFFRCRRWPMWLGSFRCNTCGSSDIRW